MASVSTAPATQAASAWHHAQKVRKHLLKQLEKLQVDGSGGIDIAQFEKVDSLLETLRLACVQTIFLDFEYAAEEKTESVLWNAHTSVNSDYRRVLGKLKGNSHVVEKRKVEKMYQNFLRIAQKFYKVYVQRITARYDIQELKRIAKGIELEQGSVDDMISPVPAQTSRLVLRSCHATLIRLGDLARYRVQAKYKKFGGYDSALTCYALAQDLIPQSGFGHHQMGIIQLEEGNQLDVVYHFYRAWATAEPHPNAKSNLEAKLKDLRAPNTPAPRQVSATPRDTFCMWFIKLHAQFYRGESFSQHAELESEVIHRLEMMAKSPDSGLIVLKTVLINISAFHIAGLRYADLKNDSSLQFARFTMGLNARFIAVVCDVLGAELAKHAGARQAEAETFDNTQFSPVLSHMLPMLRIYMIWLAAQRQEIFSTPEATGGLVPGMLQSLGRVLTLLCAEATEHKDLSSCSYLLWEDLEVRGLQPLECEQVPEPCRCYCDASGAIKPRQDSVNSRASSHGETLARMLDILRSAYYLAEERLVPLAYQVVDDALVFAYQVKQGPAATSVNDAASHQRSERIGTSEAVPQPLSVPEAPAALSVSPADTGVPPGEPTWSDFTSGEDVTNDDTENTVMSMLTPFLKPPTPQPHGNPAASSEPSYGLHSATAEEVFGSLPTQRSPGGTVLPKTFEQLPWNWLHNPTPQNADGTDRDMSPGQSVRTPEARVLSPLKQMPDYSQLSPQRSLLGARSPSAAQQIRPPSALRSPFALTADEAHRNQLLRSFSGSGSAPRTSSFSHWSPEHNASNSRNVSATSPWAPKGNMGAPMSSNSSAFSHPSSLYQGTPVDSQRGGIAPPPGFAASNSWQTSTPGERQLRVDNTTSSYDAAIFDAAFKD